MPDPPFTTRARRGDPDAAMTVQLMLEELKDQHDDLKDYVGTIAGGGGAGATYIFTQSTPLSTWTIGHSLGQYPSVTVVDSGGTELLADVVYISSNTITVTFAAATSGKAYLNY